MSLPLEKAESGRVASRGELDPGEIRLVQHARQVLQPGLDIDAEYLVVHVHDLQAIGVQPQALVDVQRLHHIDQVVGEGHVGLRGVVVPRKEVNVKSSQFLASRLHGLSEVLLVAKRGLCAASVGRLTSPLKLIIPRFSSAGSLFICQMALLLRPPCYIREVLN
jgi:hypothetical protein